MEFLNRFSVRHHFICVVHRILNFRPQRRVGGQFCHGARLWDIAVEFPPPEGILIQCDQQPDEGFTVADNHGLADERVSDQGVFQGFGGHVLAAGSDDEVFLPAGDDQVPGFEDFAQVTGVKPAVVGEGFRGCGWVVPIAVEHGGAFDEDFAVVINPHRYPPNGWAHGADFLVHEVHGGGRGGFGQPVALIDGGPNAAEKVQDFRAHGRPAGDGVVHRIAHGCPNLGIHQPVIGFVLEFEHPRRAFAGV